MIYDFYATNNIIATNQFGFKPRKSNTPLLSAFMDSIYNYLDNKENVLIVFEDYSKALDTLKHDKSLQSLHDGRIRRKLLTWCKD